VTNRGDGLWPRGIGRQALVGVVVWEMNVVRKVVVSVQLRGTLNAGEPVRGVDTGAEEPFEDGEFGLELRIKETRMRYRYWCFGKRYA
jgi:hypothetical protein